MKRLRRKIAFEGKRFNVERVVYKDNNGKEQIRDHVLTKPAVVILPVTKEGKIVLINEFRTAIGDVWSYALPAGVIKDNEDPAIAAIRELKEETGYVTNSVSYLTEVYPSKGYTNEKIYIYLAENLEKRGLQNLDEAEEIKVNVFDYDKVMKMQAKGEFNGAVANIALLMYKNIVEKKTVKTIDTSNAIKAFNDIVNKFSNAPILVISKDDKAIEINVDTVNGFVYIGPMSNPLAVEIVPNIRELKLDFARNKKEMYNVREAHPEDAIEFKYFPMHTVIGSKEAMDVDEIKDITPTDVFYKNSTNGFHNEDLRKMLKEKAEKNEIKIVVVNGFCTDICVMQVAMDIKTFFNEINKDVEVVIAMNCTQTYDAPNHNRDLFYYMALEFLSQAGVKIVSKVVFN